MLIIAVLSVAPTYVYRFLILFCCKHLSLIFIFMRVLKWMNKNCILVFVEVKYVAKHLISFVFQMLENLFTWQKCEQMSRFAFSLLEKNQY